ncbi:ABC transporter ATP-binding protein [Maledivibacter halophilus]|uniref:Fluoroquinolone transport system ATP-binding protein n=1 Tax=Maledivibacter halophilus TaxID=36842 RepID=A0A1T5MJ97_9FIRM|nr:ABC transporter ATP-binding protein [Maledivibacter halophilus]SKC87994.1 fluoroquinolone transport system ATP-binding protein [Maledivibacter halophilus]
MIEVKDLKFTYINAKEKTIKGLSFSVKKGEIFGFLGPSGAGKSTTQKILIGILKDYKGNIKVRGKEIKDWNKDFYERVGISFELPSLYRKLTALENLNFIKSFYEGKTQDSMELLEMVGLEDKANLKVSQYSKGMKMRLGFARAFIHKPELLFLDEPTSGLDPVNAKNIKEIILNKKREGKTIFLTTHNMNVAEELCDRVAFIVDGEIKLIDSPKELKIKYGKRNLRVEYYDNNDSVYKEFDLKNIGYNDRFIELLRNKPIKTIHTGEASLDEIFIQITGRRLS